MMKEIKLSKDEVIVFMGTMNAMPMMYALELRKIGYEVIYFVDVPRQDILSRPENHFPDIKYPYPPWVVEWLLPSPILLPLLPRLFAALYRRKIKKITGKSVGCYILNGFHASLAPYLNRHSSKVGLSHGSDLDVWANVAGVTTLVASFKSRSIFKYLPKVISRDLIGRIIKNQYAGYSRSDVVCYFPIGFNAEGDSVIERLVESGVKYVPRYDISFEPLVGENREFRVQTDILNIFSGVRFLYRTFPDGNRGYNKGNNIIIEGVAKYYNINSNIHLHFIEKGEDVDHAKELCKKFGIEKIITWHKEMPFKDLLALYRKSDICFDQVGGHWIGAIGGYAMWLGKPLIANADPALRSGIWPAENPICSARTAEEVCERLIELQDMDYRRKISENSKIFVEKYMNPSAVIDQIFDSVDR
jgi:hypothetical protein